MSQTTCIICAKAYNTTTKSHITDLMQKEAIPIKHYPQTCPQCIITELAVEKSQYSNNLKSATDELKDARKAFQKATIKHNKISAKYTHYDRQANYIQFFISQAQATSREQAKQLARKAGKPRKPRKTAVSKAKQADIIATLLNSLTPEQQKLVLSKATEQKEVQSTT